MEGVVVVQYLGTIIEQLVNTDGEVRRARRHRAIRRVSRRRSPERRSTRQPGSGS